MGHAGWDTFVLEGQRHLSLAPLDHLLMRVVWRSAMGALKDIIVLKVRITVYTCDQFY